MGFGEAGRRCLSKGPVFTGREQPNAFQRLALLCLPALVPAPGAITRSARLSPPAAMAGGPR